MTLRVSKHLNFYMARLEQIFFNQHLVVTKTIDGFAFAGSERCRKIFTALYDAHALATTAGTGFEQDGIAYAIRLLLQKVAFLLFSVIARHQRHGSGFHQGLGR